MNILLRELKAGVKSFLIWSGVLITFIVMGMYEFSGYAGNEEMLAILDAFPEALLEAFKFNSFNLTTVSGYFGMMSLYYILILSLHAYITGNSVISKEERDKTAEFLFMLPARRSRFITFKMICAVIYCILLNIVVLLASLLAAVPYLPDNEFILFVLLCCVSFFILQLLFLSLGMLLACTMRKYKRSGAFGISYILFAYFLSILIDFEKRLDFLKYITPFKYFDTVQILNSQKIDIWYTLLSLVLTISFVFFGYISYTKRDLYI